VEKSQQTGLFLMIGSAFTLVFFFWAIMRRSYMAVALPVLSALAVVTGLAFWIGWTLFTSEDEELEEISEASGEGAE
jgi:lipopolysaccharide export LptBFGC system permease protein LptF